MPNPRFQALTPEAIRDAAREMRAKPIRKWSVRVGGRDFPVKQIVQEAANRLPGNAPPVTPADLTAHEAVRHLKRLGFEDSLRYEE